MWTARVSEWGNVEIITPTGERVALLLRTSTCPENIDFSQFVEQVNRA